MKDPYAEVFEEIGNAFQKHTKMINELAKMCLTVKQYEDFIKITQEINKPTKKED